MILIRVISGVAEAKQSSKMTKPNLGETKLSCPRDIFRVAVIGQISEDLERFFQTLTRSERKLLGSSLSETVMNGGRSVTFWALQGRWMIQQSLSQLPRCITWERRRRRRSTTTGFLSKT